ncbi:MAG: substrate-binding domain-containing protein, partial [Planctomycetota bacterium]
GGLASVLRESGHALASDWIVPQAKYDSMQAAYETAGQFAARWKATPAEERPTAVACPNDQFAICALCAFAEAGLRVPEDLSVVGQDNLPEIRYTVPPLTTVDFDVPGLIAPAIDLLLARIHKPAKARETVSSPPGRIVPRRSVGPPAA